MDLLVPCIVEGRSELRNIGRVNCKTHWPISGCGTPYLLNEKVTSQFALFWALQCAWLSVRCYIQISHLKYDALYLIISTFFALLSVLILQNAMM